MIKKLNGLNGILSRKCFWLNRWSRTSSGQNGSARLWPLFSLTSYGDSLKGARKDRKVSEFKVSVPLATASPWNCPESRQKTGAQIKLRTDDLSIVCFDVYPGHPSLPEASSGSDHALKGFWSSLDGLERRSGTFLHKVLAGGLGSFQ